MNVDTRHTHLRPAPHEGTELRARADFRRLPSDWGYARHHQTRQNAQATLLFQGSPEPLTTAQRSMSDSDFSGSSSTPVLINLEQFLPFRISVLSNRVSANIAKIYGDRYGIAIPEWRVITILALYPGSSASEVSDHSAMDKVAVSRAVARLLERGFIRRETHGDDRRRSMLALSPAGRQVYETVAPLVNEMEDRLMSALTEEERDVLERLIERMAKDGLPRMVQRG